LRKVGVYRRHGKLEGRWLDVVIVAIDHKEPAKRKSPRLKVWVLKKTKERLAEAAAP
jgi:hypothetical protein